MRTIAAFLLLITAPALVACGRSAPEQSADATGPGQALYESSCAMCHGMDGVASRIGRGAVDLNDPAWQRRTSVEQIIEVVAEGRGQMPAWKSRLSDEEIRAIADYVRTLQ